MKTLLIAAAASAIAMASPAAAETFDGPYVGAQLGYSHDKYGTVDSDIGQITINDSRDSVTGGIYGGYDHRVNDRIVIGLEGGFDIGASDNRRERQGANLVDIDPRFTFSASARAGYLVTPQTLVYVRGGYENVDARVTVANAAGTNRDSRSYDGWSVGGGVERYVTTNVSARLEYRYSDLGGSDTKFERHQALFGLSYHF